MRVVVQLFCLTMLCRYSLAGELRWPHPLEPDALGIVGKRFAVGSARRLGTQEDVSQIRATVAGRKSSTHISDIRWLSPTLVVAAGTDGPYQVFWAVAKKCGKWEVLVEYNRHHPI
jgi:hypothetical protein